VAQFQQKNAAILFSKSSRLRQAECVFESAIDNGEEISVELSNYTLDVLLPDGVNVAAL
jgi:hypothetical protein